MNANMSSETTSPAETVRLGYSLAGRLTAGDVVALYGDLGSGKTHLAKGICAGLGIDPEHVTSPTFALINEYPGGRMPVYHFDTYRLKSLAEFMALGYEDYFEGHGVCLIEWPEPIESLLPDDVIRVHLKHAGDSRRVIEISTWRTSLE
jgi:tRNA threonylcarbamoyladenosine biosynthesis protein TsaE